MFQSPFFIYYLQSSSVDWNYTADLGQNEKNCHRASAYDLILGKMLGGTSGINYLLYNEGNCRDYNQWAVASNDSSWRGNSVLPFFIKSQRLNDSDIENSPDRKYYGFEGPIIITKDKTPEASEYLEAFKELNYPIVSDLNLKNTIGYTSAMYNLEEGRRQQTAYSYLRDIRKYSNLFVLKNTFVIKIVFDDNKNAIAVVVRTKDGKLLTLKASKEIIVCAGAINTPKLLMLSGIGVEKHLNMHGIHSISNVPVGKNLIDQNSVILVHDLKNTNPQTEPKDPKVYPASVFIGHISLNESETQPEYLAINYVNYRSDLIRYIAQSYGINQCISNAFFKAGNTPKGINENKILFSVISKLHPKSRGEVTLTSSNYDDPPKVQPAYYDEADDLDDQVKYIKDFIRVGKTKLFKKLGAVRLHPKLPVCSDLKRGSTDYWKCYAKCVSSPKHYYCGTCAMGSVVDGKLRVYGVKRLRVVDASVMPTSSTGGTLGAVVMIAEKAAHMIKEEHSL